MAKQSVDVSSFLALGECMNENPGAMVYMAEKMLRIRSKDGRIRALQANEVQWLFEVRRGRQNVVLKARQMGMTTWVAGRFLLRTMFQPGTTTLLVAHTREAGESIFATVRRMWELMPEVYREDLPEARRINTSELVFATGSEFRVASAADVNAGRGLSVTNLHCSEVSRWPGEAQDTLAGLRAALVPQGELVLESTPNGAYGAFYEAWRDAVDAPEAQQHGDEVVRHFFPWWMERTYLGAEICAEEMSAEERGLVERHGLSAAQVGFRRGLERAYGALRSQEFAEDAETCFRATGACCFELEVVERRLLEAPEPVRRLRNGALWEWLPFVPGRRYVVAADTAGGGEEGDFAAVQIVDVLTGMQCAELQERLRPAELARVCAELSAAYGGALVAVERNNHGAAVLALLEHSPEVPLYRQGHEAGWLTSAASKPEMLARLGTLLVETPERFMSRRLLGECRTFVRDERGRAGAAAGAHDDLVMAMAVAQAVRAEVVGRG